MLLVWSLFVRERSILRRHLKPPLLPSRIDVTFGQDPCLAPGQTLMSAGDSFVPFHLKRPLGFTFDRPPLVPSAVEVAQMFKPQGTPAQQTEQQMAFFEFNPATNELLPMTQESLDAAVKDGAAPGGKYTLRTYLSFDLFGLLFRKMIGQRKDL